MCAQTLLVKNNSGKEIIDYTLEIPAEELNLKMGNYQALVNGEFVPLEVITDIKNRQIVILPINKLPANKETTVKIEKGTSENYPKRTYAELSHKIGGQFEGHKYVGGYSWVKPNYITLPGAFRDHSYYIKYEGPGWESDKVAFRFYLDNRNAIDVFAKKTSDIVLPAVGVDGFDNYHNMADWGMDNMKVGKALGIGSIAIWDGQKAVRVEKKDSITCLIPADGKIRSQVKTIYYGWDANSQKCDLTSLISIDAGSRASHMELLVNKNIDNIATGIIKSEDAELIVNNDKNSEWSYIATFGKQSLNNDMQGLVVFARTKQIKEITGDDLNHVIVLKPENGYTEYYFMPTWELDKEPVKTKEDMQRCIDEVMNRLNNKVTYKITK
ncbi:DUF4861 family protein [Dysgonomonas hofstadii]|uniref:DUF4861 family protein n=1 Tax=Dysgonomonas hofstadii TaxID=637886 RepID=UPI0016115741|nr:DUF4861 family protein [Dysgonomonas hofstadii]